ncbi:SRPBCC family protein [Nonomuraea sp. NPDC050383]|uniref:SRPBCC family protein n=1 Tax=Nonomuraea sp. NPDC050383 TaxID=3364362 RepID=UPI0037B9BC19
MADVSKADEAAPDLEGPKDELVSALQDLAMALAERAMGSITDKLGGLTGRLTDVAEGGGEGLLGAITGKGGGFSPGKMLLSGATKAIGSAITGGKKGGKGKGGKKLKLVNIVEAIDVGAPIRVVYNQWTQFQDFPSFMKKVETVNQESEEKLSWKAQVFWSHRVWKSSIQEQVPEDRIIWRSEGAKGYVDGAVTFHELTPNLTRVLVILEYHPQGLFERTGNIWRAQGRRARLEIKHFARHVTTHVMLHPDELADEGGWRGEIHEGKVTKDDETARQEERDQEEQGQEEEGAEEEGAEEQPQDQGEAEEGEEPEEGEEAEEGEEPEDEYEGEEGEEGEEEEGEEEEEEPEEPQDEGAEEEPEGRADEEEEEEEEEPPPARRPARRRAATAGRR